MEAERSPSRSRALRTADSFGYPNRVGHGPDDFAAFGAAAVPAQFGANVAAAGYVEREVVGRLDFVERTDVDWDAVRDEPEAAVHAAAVVRSETHGAAARRGSDSVAHQRFEA